VAVLLLPVPLLLVPSVDPYIRSELVQAIGGDSTEFLQSN
jgi:hypothetical protein